MNRGSVRFGLQSKMLLLFMVINLAGIVGYSWLIYLDREQAILHHNDGLLHVAIIGLKIVAIALLLTWLVARNLTRPLRELLHVTQRIANGDYRLRVPVRRPDEIGQLADSLNRMGEAIAIRERDLRNQALQDELTGLGNRKSLQQQLTRLESVPDTRVLLILVHIDRMWVINDLLGFEAGDIALRLTARRLERLPLEHAECFRMSGNVFALLVCNSQQTESDICGLLIRELEGTPLRVDEHQVDLSITLGLAGYPQADGRGDISQLSHYAEVALYAAKHQHRQWAEFNPLERERHHTKLSLLGELKRALANQELQVHYQPQVELITGHPMQAEALIRWKHPQRGWVAPSEFIPFAEETGRIRQLTDWMLDAVCQQVADWRRQLIPLPVSVNISMCDLADPAFAGRVLGKLAAHSASPCDLCLEITESALMAEPERVLHTLKELHRAGLRISIDDFGTGYSSLAYLSRLPVDELKIDRGFLTDLTPHNRSIVRSIVSLGHALGLSVIAEGVETTEVYQEMQHAGCDLAQGYLIARPLPLAEFETWRHRMRNGFVVLEADRR
ncbi:MAG: EAL domain-containing protein [Laribacter sp.]|nr:EAL domain-containing protein [Laribacter sp.]